MSDKTGKVYRVLGGDIDILEDGKFVRQKKGTEVRLSAAAAEHLLAAGYVEEAKPKKGGTE